MGNLLCSCVEVHEVIKLPFGVVSGIDSGIGVLDGGAQCTSPRRTGGLMVWGFSSICFNGDFEFIHQRNIFDLCEKI